MTAISNNDIARAIYSVSKNKTEKELSEINKKIVDFLFRKRLFSRKTGILEKLEEIINKDEQKLPVKLSAARKLKETEKNNLASFLKKRYRIKDIILTEILEEKLLGGMKIEAEDEIIDLTAKNKMKKLQEYLSR